MTSLSAARDETGRFKVADESFDLPRHAPRKGTCKARRPYSQSEYGKVILPFTVLRRLDCVLETTKPAVMYLNRDEIKTTLSAVEARSVSGSRLIVAYHQPALMLLLLALIVRRLGEPIRTVLTPQQMRKLLAGYGFCTRWDRDLPAIGSELSAEIGHATRLMRHLRIATADRKDTSSPG